MPQHELAAFGLSKKYRNRYAVRSVSLNVKNGEIVGLLGPNGAGKTTMFYMMVGLVDPDAGRILMNSLDISDLLMHSRAEKGIGYLPQEASVFRKLSVADNLMVALEARNDLNRSQRKKKLEELLHEFQIEQIRSSYGLALSGGERRRVEIARAFAAEPSFILLDEPFAGVDPISVAEVQKLMKQLSDYGIGLLVTDHNVRETLGICDRAYIMNEGEVIASGEAHEIISNERVKQVYLGRDFRI